MCGDGPDGPEKPHSGSTPQRLGKPTEFESQIHSEEFMLVTNWFESPV